jgi:hypothetical protein
MPKWTREKAIEAVTNMARKDGNPGDLTTGICKALDISFDHFLQFAQLDEKGQKRVVQGLALALLTKKFGHCAQ